jgi:hypothetical protein
LKVARLPKSFQVPPEGYKIRHVADYIGCCTKTIKKAESDGRIPMARRATNGYRIYNIAEVEVIAEALIGPDFRSILGDFPEILFKKRLSQETR